MTEAAVAVKFAAAGQKAVAYVDCTLALLRSPDSAATVDQRDSFSEVQVVRKSPNPPRTCLAFFLDLRSAGADD